ncbi:MAG: CDP-alcohol phosphatidyltransferase family protein [Verrucomicrobia bacterium]|nr:CDP-alcohol phosphatidyltransferase family protein [Verrucomicrobiota bacterium]
MNPPACLPGSPDRRTVRSRSAGWAVRLSRVLGRTRLSPNAISLLGLAFALAGAAGLVRLHGGGPPTRLLLVAAICIQLRLLCNLMDGMVAIEGGKGSATGILFNEVPDRLEDVLLLVGAGLAVQMQPAGLHLGWACAVLALGTAYVRSLGGSLGLAQDFCGPMAKPQRMFVLTLGCLVGALEALKFDSYRALMAALVIIAAGSLWTIARRLTRIYRQLASRP